MLTISFYQSFNEDALHNLYHILIGKSFDDND